MGQVEVYELLKEKLIFDDESYFSAVQIEKMLKDKGYSNGVLKNVRPNLISLEAMGYLEVKMSGDIRDWLRLYRLKKKYLNR